MNTLVLCIGIYILASIIIGLLASRKVKTASDFILAGRGLPLYIVIATTFATWFGSEAILGAPSTFQTDWLLGILADPFGAGLCLILVGFFLAKPLYKAGITTLWDFYKQKYWRWVEFFASLMIIISYIGWVSAQIVALGLIFDILSTWSSLDFITQMQWSIIWATIVLIYTFFGWMWAVALTDFFQMILITIGIIIASIYVIGSSEAWGITSVISHAIENDKFNLMPNWFSYSSVMAILVALLTLWFGSIPQQDIFQRVLSANNAQNSSRGGIIGGSLYILICIFPLLLGYSAVLVAPELVANTEDTQRVLPTLILTMTPFAVQVLFFGALIAAIMSTASGTLIAPSALLTENIVHPFFPKLSDKKVLWLNRVMMLVFFAVIIGFVLYKYQNAEANIFHMVENAYKITLAGAFVPLVAGVFCKKVYKISAIISMILGVSSWIILEFFMKIELILEMPPHFFGFILSIFGFIAGQLISKYKKSH